jgi:hypothetical protein
MSHFAKIENGIVTEILAAEQDHIDSGVVGDPSLWVQTSYNTKGGIHYDPATRQPDGGVALRMNYAMIGGTYDPVRDAFIDPKPFSSWVLDESICQWKAPIPKPDDGIPESEYHFYSWHEETLTWVLFEKPQP